MIVDPINDHQCLDQLTKIARELANTTLIRTVAKRLGTREKVIEWFQSLPQEDDFGDESVRFIQCDVPQRVRLLPDGPNCVERSLGALMLLEVIDPKTPRALATVDKPLRHTGLVEKYGDHWRAVDLFPRRNAQRNFRWDEFAKDVLQGAHNYVGKPILKFYGGEAGAKAADAIGKQENRWIGRDKKKAPEKKSAPPPASTKRPANPPPRSRVEFTRLVGAGANQGKAAPAGAGGKDGQKEKVPSHSGAAVFDGATARRSVEAADGGDRDPHHARAAPQRFWWTLGR